MQCECKSECADTVCLLAAISSWGWVRCIAKPEKLRVSIPKRGERSLSHVLQLDVLQSNVRDVQCVEGRVFFEISSGE
jgi:hypothetical protein